MKISAVALLSILGVASAVTSGKPQLSITVRDGNFDGLEGLDPTLKWEAASTSGDVELSYGIESAARPTKDIASLPRTVWGKATADVSGWGVTARADVDAQERRSADVQIDADNSELDVSVKLIGSAGGDGVDVRSVEATKGMDMDGARVTITPRYNLQSEEKDVVIGYNNGATAVKLTASQDAQEVEIAHKAGDTDIKLIASAEAQELTVSQQVDEDNRVAPTINNNGDISIEWERRLGDDSSLLTTLRPNDRLDVEWQDDAWTANVNMPLDGTDINGANVSIKRDVKF